MLFFDAIALLSSKLGVEDDEFGYMLADILKKNKVNNSGMRFDPAARTALVFVILRSDGESLAALSPTPSPPRFSPSASPKASSVPEAQSPAMTTNPNATTALTPPSDITRYPTTNSGV
ncbi:hypothetical protein AgCh_017917 [Apium graveolens]